MYMYNIVTMVNATRRVKHALHTYARTSCVEECHIHVCWFTHACIHDDESLKTIST